MILYKYGGISTVQLPFSVFVYPTPCGLTVTIHDYFTNDLELFTIVINKWVFIVVSFVLNTRLNSMAMAAANTDEENSGLLLHVDSNSGTFLNLTKSNVSVIRRAEEICRVLLEDVLGVEIKRTKGAKIDMTIHGLAKTKKVFRGEGRWRKKIRHSFDSADPTENERLATEWKQKIIVESRRVIQKKYNWYYEGKQLNYVIMLHYINK